MEKEIINDLEEMFEIKQKLEDYYKIYSPKIEKGYSQKRSCFLNKESQILANILFSLLFMILSSSMFVIYALDFSSLGDISYIKMTFFYFLAITLFFVTSSLFTFNRKILKFLNNILIFFIPDLRRKYFTLKKNFHNDIQKINKLEDRLLHLNDSYDKIIKEIDKDKLYEEFLISVYNGKIGYSANYFFMNFNFKISELESKNLRKITKKNLIIKLKAE